MSTKRVAGGPPRPWAGLGAGIGVVAAVGWLPSWTFTGILAPFGLLCVAAGWRSAQRRWLLWFALVVNLLVVLATAWAWSRA